MEDDWIGSFRHDFGPQPLVPDNFDWDTKKFEARKEEKTTTTTQHAVFQKSLEKTTDAMRHKKIASDNARLISLARNQLKMTQKQLSTKLSIDQAHLASIEAGTAIHNPTEIAKIKRFLGLCK